MRLKLYINEKDVIEKNVRLRTGYLLTTHLNKQFCEERGETTLSFPFIVCNNKNCLYAIEKENFITKSKEEFIYEGRMTEDMYESIKIMFDSLGEDNDYFL
jgi:hypothetical protein